MDFSKLVPVEWSSRRVLTTAQLADAYECSVDQIKVNFNANKKHYKEGLHYFKIAGKALADLRVRIPYLQISSMTRCLYLWTEQGAVRHCKSINTTEAWNMFDKLEENYFNPKPSIVSAPASAAKREPVVTFPEAIYRVYAILFRGGIVKTGCTKRLCTRMSEVKREFKREIERATKCEIVDIYFSPFMCCEEARLVERCCKEIFSSQCVKGEFFSAEFAEVCAAIDRFVKLAAVKPLVTKHYIATEKLFVDKNSN